MKNTCFKVMITSLIVNVALSLLKIIIGIIAYSNALVADGFHSLSDLITDVFALLGIKMSTKPADDEHPYGHGKMEYLISLAIGLFIIVLGIGIIYTTLSKELIIPDPIVIVITLITIGSKNILANYIIRNGKLLNNNILIASGKESKTDVISSIIVLISSVLMLFSKYIEILKYSDIFAAIIVGLLIMKVGITILKENISTIIDEQVLDSDYIETITNTILTFPDVSKIDSVILLKNGPYYKLLLELSMNERLTLQYVHQVIENIEQRLKQTDDKLYYITTHVNPRRSDDCARITRSRNSKRKPKKKINR